jgi:predicted transcriptional regulator
MTDILDLKARANTNLVSRICRILLLCWLLALCGAQTATARFLSPDTWDPFIDGVDINRYSYSGNDPVNGSDPNGHIGAIPGYGQSPDQLAEMQATIAERDLSIAETLVGLEGPLEAATAVELGCACPGELAAPITGAAAVLARGAKLLTPELRAAAAARRALTDHHLIPKEVFTKINELAGLGVSVNSRGNIFRIAQNGGTHAHRVYTQRVLSEVSAIVRQLKTGAITPKEALRKIAELRSELRKTLKQDPDHLLRKKDGSISEPKPKSSTSGNGGSKTSDSKGGDDKPSAGCNWNGC